MTTFTIISIVLVIALACLFGLLWLIDRAEPPPPTPAQRYYEKHHRPLYTNYTGSDTGPYDA